MPEPKRALILAGGGLKVAFQAGVLQVWLDEAGLDFGFADGASGGVFNLAMWCSGQSGTQIADKWRQTNPLDFVAVNPRPWVALSSLERFRTKVLPKWEVDWHDIKRPNATFNVYNFTRQELQTRAPEHMNDDWLLACVSLPMWFPPVVIDGETYIDPVYATDANLQNAVDAGATELWVIWTVSTRGRWRNGPVNQYFQIIENAAVWRFKEALRQLGPEIEVKILWAEVPLHYLLVFSPDRLHEAVELGVRRGREWCIEHGVPLVNPPRPESRDPNWLRFVETMRGELALGEDRRADVAVQLKVEGGARKLLADPSHEAQLTGWVKSGALGGRLPILDGTLNLFAYGDDFDQRRMLYRVRFRDGVGHMLTLFGEKLVPRLPAIHPWRDTTTVFTRLVRESPAPAGKVAASGVIRVSPLGVLGELVTMRASGVGVVARFFAFFLGTLARVYLRR